MGPGGQRGRDLQVAPGAGGHLRRGTGSRRRRRRRRLLPHRGTVVAHLVRPHPPARLRDGAQLRRLLDRVGQLGANPYRAMTETMTETAAPLPPALEEIAEDFSSASSPEK